MDAWVVAFQVLGVSVIIGNMFWLKATGNMPRSAGVLLFCMLAIHLVNANFAGGIDTVHFAWIFIFPILAGGTMGWRGQLLFYFFCVLGTAYYAVFPEQMPVLPYENSMGYTFFTRLMCLTVFTLIMLIYYFTLNEKMEELKEVLKIASFESDLFSGVFNSNAQGVVLLDENYVIKRANPKAHNVFGVENGGLINQNMEKLLEKNEAPFELVEHDQTNVEFPISIANDDIIWVEYSLLNVIDEHNKTFKLITFEDISERKRYQSSLFNLARFDHLTQLPNRLAIQEQLQAMIEHASTNQEQFAVVFFDLDKFKHVNDIQGHQAGDVVLQEVAKRMRNLKQSGEMVGRFGGDEFVLLLPNIESQNDVIEQINAMQEQLKLAIEHQKSEFFIGSSAGIACYPNDATSADELIQKADLAMYKAKAIGRGHYQFYSKEHDQSIKRQISIGHNLQFAIQREEFRLLYQPIYDANGNMSGVEALIRWHNDELGHITPDEFIPISEENGLIVPLGFWVLNEACEALKQLHKKGYTHLTMSVNMSYKQIASIDMAKSLEQVLDDHKLAGSALILELTERVFAEDLDLVNENIAAFEKLGVHTAVDDFGVGYSSLSYLMHSQFSALKIDRSFIKDMQQNPDARKLCSAIASMAGGLGLTVTAEGVETQEQLAMLKKMKIQKYQGYYFAKPLPLDEVEQMLDKESTFVKSDCDTDYMI